ncbi:MAG: hypothetical protein M1415_01095 [Firmicutes bacterium]|nr:hypothetical protein [Bacillota bacterium]MCL5063965.1 hypothetical protein [Bacillota bacterium]
MDDRSMDAQVSPGSRSISRRLASQCQRNANWASGTLKYGGYPESATTGV